MKFSILLSFILLAPQVWAHHGPVDAQSGHTDLRNGEYHFHDHDHGRENLSKESPKAEKVKAEKNREPDSSRKSRKE